MAASTATATVLIHPAPLTLATSSAAAAAALGPRRPPSLSPALPPKKQALAPKPSLPRRITKSLLQGLHLIKTGPAQNSSLSDSLTKLPLSPKDDAKSPTTPTLTSPVGDVIDIPLFYSNPLETDVDVEPLSSPKSLDELTPPAYSYPLPSFCQPRVNLGMNASTTAAAAAVATIQSSPAYLSPPVSSDFKSYPHQSALTGLPEVPSPMEHDDVQSDLESDDMDTPMINGLQSSSDLHNVNSNHTRQRSFSLDSNFPSSNSDASFVRPILKKNDSRRLSTGSLRFSNQVLVGLTHNPLDYERKGELTWRLTPESAMAIKRELNEFKQEMEIHEESRRFTHFFTS